MATKVIRTMRNFHLKHRAKEVNIIMASTPHSTAHLPLRLAPIILAIRSSMRLASQNGAKASFSHAELDSTDCFAPWNVHAQLKGCSVRCGIGSDCLPEKCQRETCCIHGSYPTCVFPLGLRSFGCGRHVGVAASMAAHNPYTSLS